MTTHNLKIQRQPFEDLVSGRKTGEVRNCSDREFREGDQVELFLIDETGNPANKSIVRTITHIQRGYGLPDDICVLSYAAPVVERQEPVVLTIPDECPHLIMFDDTEREDLLFSGAGARSAALKTWEKISMSWNAHLFVRVERNSRDDRYPSARTSPPAPVAVDDLQAIQDRHEAWKAGEAHGVESAARLVEKRMDDYLNEHGSSDQETGAVELPGNGEEYVGELMDIAESIRTSACLDKVKEMNR